MVDCIDHFSSVRSLGSFCPSAILGQSFGCSWRMPSAVEWLKYGIIDLRKSKPWDTNRGAFARQPCLILDR